MLPQQKKTVGRRGRVTYLQDLNGILDYAKGTQVADWNKVRDVPVHEDFAWQ